MDAEGGRVVHRERRSRKLAVVVTVQNVLVAACLLVTFYVYWGVQERPSEDDIHILLGAISSISVNETLQFSRTESNYKMSLDDEKRTKINVNCSGPYVLYMKVCYKSLTRDLTTGTLELQVVGRKTPSSIFNLNASSINDVCDGLQSILYLSAKDQASLYLNVKEGFKIKNLTVGLNYLLGRRCIY